MQCRTFFASLAAIGAAARLTQFSPAQAWWASATFQTVDLDIFRESLEALEEIRADHVEPPAVPLWFGAMIGHQMQPWSLPVGAFVEIDASKGCLTLLASAVE